MQLFNYQNHFEEYLCISSALKVQIESSQQL